MLLFFVFMSLTFIFWINLSFHFKFASRNESMIRHSYLIGSQLLLDSGGIRLIHVFGRVTVGR